MIVTVSEEGRLVIPAEIRRLLGITPGTRLNVLPDAGGFRVLVEDAGKNRSAAECVGVSGYKGRTIPVDEMDAAKFAFRP